MSTVTQIAAVVAIMGGLTVGLAVLLFLILHVWGPMLDKIYDRHERKRARR